MRQKKVYPWTVDARLQDTIPAEVQWALHAKGWNVFGIYEAVKAAIAADKRARKRKEPPQ